MQNPSAAPHHAPEFALAASLVIVLWFTIAFARGAAAADAPLNEPGKTKTTAVESTEKGGAESKGGTGFAGIITAVVTGIVGLAAGFFTSELQKRDARIKEWDRIRTTYLTPLRSSSGELPQWLSIVIDKLRDPNPQTKKELLDWFQRIKDTAESRRSRDGFFGACNAELYFAVGTMYATARYLAIARRVRAEMPYIAIRDAQRNQLNDEQLLTAINEVRNAFSGDIDGLWETLQDSIGDAITLPTGDPCTYREFCAILLDGQTWVWLLRLMDFYRDIGNKEGKLQEIRTKLIDLHDLVVKLYKRRIRI